MKYIDVHCHLDFKDYDADRQAVLERMEEEEIWAITIGTDLESSKRAVAIAEQNENVWACIGVHPVPAPSPLQGEGWGEVEKEFEKLVSHSKVVAIGECGLDYFRIKESHFAEATRDEQKILFKQQIEFAISHDKPLMLHCRNSYDDVLSILEKYKKEAGEKLRGNAHFFAGNIEQAKKFLDLGFTMSFTGVITFTNDYDEVIKFLPPGAIMSETDAPFVTPVPYRGKRNEPTFVTEVVKKMAEIRSEDMSKLQMQIIENSQRIFNLPK